jgi:PBP1b-binding outer membrane lipoprotein LpoB
MKNWKTVVIMGAAALLFVGCSQPTAPSLEDSACRSGYNVSSGRSCE